MAYEPILQMRLKPRYVLERNIYYVLFPDSLKKSTIPVQKHYLVNRIGLSVPLSPPSVRRGLCACRLSLWPGNGECYSPLWEPRGRSAIPV